MLKCEFFRTAAAAAAMLLAAADASAIGINEPFGMQGQLQFQ